VKPVLIAGAAGKIGRKLRTHLEGRQIFPAAALPKSRDGSDRPWQGSRREYIEATTAGSDKRGQTGGERIVISSQLEVITRDYL
jgi:hypothetical protein